MTRPPALRAGLRRATAGLAATATAAALMTAATAAPARAGERDLAKLLVGIAAVALIAKAIDDRRDRREARRETPPEDPGRPHPPFVPREPRAEDPRIPGDCALEVRGGRGDRLAYGESCLVSYGFRDLPRSCAYEATIFGRADRLYPSACLRDAGFRLPRG